MALSKRQIQIVLSAFLIFLQVSGFVAPFDKHDDVLPSPQDQQSVSTHGCTSKELHKNIDLKHFCLACYRQLNSTAKLHLDCVIPNIFVLEFYYPLFSLDHSFRIVVPPVLRGPPAVLTLA